MFTLTFNAPGGCFLKLDVHHSGPEEVFVLEGTFNDGIRDYPAGSLIHNPLGSSYSSIRRQLQAPRPASRRLSRTRSESAMIG